MNVRTVSKRKQPLPVKGFRGEPWSTDGTYIYDRDGSPFAEVFRDCEEFAKTIVLCVNVLTNVPLRPHDHPPLTKPQEYALQVLALAAQQIGDDPR